MFPSPAPWESEIETFEKDFRKNFPNHSRGDLFPAIENVVGGLRDILSHVQMCRFWNDHAERLPGDVAGYLVQLFKNGYTIEAADYDLACYYLDTKRGFNGLRRLLGAFETLGGLRSGLQLSQDHVQNTPERRLLTRPRTRPLVTHGSPNN